MSFQPPDSTEPSIPVTAFAPFRYHDFRLFWTSLLISNIGSWMQTTATSWLLYQLTDSAFQLGLNGFFRAVPTICLGLVGGTLADKYERKRLVLVTQLGLMLFTLLLAVLDYTGRIQVWQIYGITLASGALSTVDGPSRQALLPSLVPRELLPSAIALHSVLWRGTVILGPALAGVVIATVGTAGAFFANGVTYLGVVSALFLMTTTSRGGGARGHMMQDIAAGMQYVSTQPAILATMVMESASSLFGLDNAVLTIFARDILAVGASGLGFLQSARGLGAIIGSVLMVGLISRARRPGKTLIASALLYGIAVILFSVSYSFSLSLLLMVVIGSTDTIWGAVRNIIIQLQTPEAIRGRVMGIYNLTSRGLHPLGQTRSGLTIPLMGAREATLLGGALVAGVVLATLWKTRAVYRFTLNR